MTRDLEKKDKKRACARCDSIVFPLNSASFDGTDAVHFDRGGNIKTKWRYVQGGQNSSKTLNFMAFQIENDRFIYISHSLENRGNYFRISLFVG